MRLPKSAVGAAGILAAKEADCGASVLVGEFFFRALGGYSDGVPGT
jgi:hypothetical protein